MQLGEGEAGGERAWDGQPDWEGQPREVADADAATGLRWLARCGRFTGVDGHDAGVVLPGRCLRRHMGLEADGGAGVRGEEHLLVIELEPPANLVGGGGREAGAAGVGGDQVRRGEPHDPRPRGEVLDAHASRQRLARHDCEAKRGPADRRDQEPDLRRRLGGGEGGR